MSSFSIRPVTSADLDEMLALYEAVASEGRWIGAELPVDRDRRLRSWSERYIEGPGALFVAEEEAAIIGQATLEWMGGACDFGMLVAKEWRGRGVGSALTKTSIEWARAQGAHKIGLQVWPHNEDAIALYERFGFVREGYLRRQWRRKSGEIWDAIVMGLVLEP